MKFLRCVVAAGIVVFTGVARSSAQDASTDKRLEELERKLGEQQNQIADQQKKIDDLERARTGPGEGKPGAGKPGAPAKPGAPGAGDTPPPAFDWGFDDGFYVKGKIQDAEYELRPRALLQLDYWAHPHAGANVLFPHPIQEDSFVVARARVGFSGKFSVFGFDLEVDPVRPAGTIPLDDFWLQYQQWSELRLKVGHYTVPFAPDGGTLIEGPMIVGVGTAGAETAGGYAPGAEVNGEIGSGFLLRYYLSAQNPVDSSTVAPGGPQVFSRLEGTFAGATLGVSGIWVRHGGPPTPGFTFVTPGLYTFFPPVNVHGWDQRYEVDTSYNMGPPVFVNMSYVWAHQDRDRCGNLGLLGTGIDGTPLVSQGASLTLAYMFWGPVKGHPPHKLPFADWELFDFSISNDKSHRRVGAEIVARVEWIDIHDARGGQSTFAGVPVPRSTAPDAVRVRGDQGWATTLGLNFYLIENVTLMADWVHVHLGDQTRAEKAHSRDSEELLFRSQIEF